MCVLRIRLDSKNIHYSTANMFPLSSMFLSTILLPFFSVVWRLVHCTEHQYNIGLLYFNQDPEFSVYHRTSHSKRSILFREYVFVKCFSQLVCLALLMAALFSFAE